MEDEVEPHQPDEVIGNRQFEQSLDRLENLHFLGWKSCFHALSRRDYVQSNHGGFRVQGDTSGGEPGLG